ncbi:MAG: hypothetical protein EXR92_03150 [Gemmatimonadetes bacterium]|nr:hypothetical protein [Gemmatimonadota bacterium]
MGGGAGANGPETIAPVDAPPIRQGLRNDVEARATAALLTEGENLFRDGRFAVALERAREVEERYPEAQGSSLALWLDARASARVDDWQASRAAVERYLEIVGAEGPYRVEALVLRVSGLLETGGDALGALLQLPADVDPELLTDADSLAFTIGRGMDTAALRELIANAPRHPRIFPSFVVEMAVRRYLFGAEEEARQLATQVLAMAPGERVRARATSVIEGRVEEELTASGALGAILASSGSPSLRQVSLEIQEGIEVAIAEASDGGGPVRLVPVVDEDNPSGVAEAIRGFESEGAIGVVGPLLESNMDAMARSRTGPLPILSPTAPSVPPGLEGVYTLTGIDPEAGRALAALVLREGLRRVVVLHSASNEMNEEARWFRQAFEGGGGVVARTLTYPPGTTGFGPQLEEVVRLAPAGLVLLLPQGEGDVELLAPQVSFYGVREVEGIRLFGNESWTEAAVLQAVQRRHMEGVRAVTSWPVEGEFGPAWTRFVMAYEERFQRTLRSPTPAWGYDAARLLLSASRLGGGLPAGTLRALREIRDFQGATGILSVVDDRIVREYFPVRIGNGRLVSLSP